MRPVQNESKNEEFLFFLLQIPSNVTLMVYGEYFLSYTQFDLVRKPSNLGAHIGYFTPCHVIHQRL